MPALREKSGNSLAIYVHWPFCQAKCPYCDFNSFVSDAVDHDTWSSAYLSELERYSSDLPGRTITSVFFGGGTPSLMHPRVPENVITKIESCWPLSENVEITLEANPTSVEAGRFRDFRSAGVNRVSVGVPALDDSDLRQLGRMHTVDEALAAVETANGAFDRVSFDLIYARQDQTVGAWENELNQALTLGPSHLSLYQLTIEDGTVFGERHRRGLLKGLPSQDSGADMFEVTQSLTRTAGLPAYEVSNHAKSGHQSRHNLSYWRSEDWIGIGPGAHGRFRTGGQRIATSTLLQPKAWLDAARAGSGEHPRELVSASDQGAEYVIMGLRLNEGIRLSEFRRLTGRDLPANATDSLIRAGLVSVSGDRLATTAQGRLLLNSVLETLLA